MRISLQHGYGLRLAALLPIALLACSGTSGDSTGSSESSATSSTEIAGVTFNVPNGQFIGAQGNGGSTVIATATVAQAWETFTLIDQNGGTLNSGDLVFIRAGGGQYFQALNGGGSTLNAASQNQLDWESFRVVKASGIGAIHSGDSIGLQTKTTGNWVSAANAGGGAVFAYGAALGAWEHLTINLPATTPPPPPPSGGDAGTTPPPPPPPPGSAPDFGPNVLIFDPSMSMTTIQNKISGIYNQQQSNQFGNQRYTYFFKPGQYNLDVKIGFYMTAVGLGASPDDVTITGSVRSKADWFNGNATQNFWRGAENLSVVPTTDGNVDIWAVSQATTLRRIHMKGSINLWDSSYSNAWSSGGFIADSKIDGTINSGTQQQFLTRNTALHNWQGANWNMVFVGDENTPSGTWPGSPYTIVGTTPVVREKPYLTIDSAGNYSVKVPPLKTSSSGISWANGASPGTSLPISTFYVARSDKDSADTINAALAAGKNLILTPGVYHLSSTIQVNRAGTVILGLGVASVIPDKGQTAMAVADVDGVSIGGVLFDAGPTNSNTLLQLGSAPSSVSHAANPTALFDVSCRVGGAAVGKTNSCVTLDSNDVIIDNAWLWRADHSNDVGWDTNPSKNGIIVNGNNVSAYGLFVEHFEEYQTLWNGNGGRVYFYQSEIPYDVPSQNRWTHNGVNGYSSFKVGDSVTSLDARGLGVYCVFFNSVVLENAIETPNRSGVAFQHMITVWLGSAGGSAINHIINGSGDTVSSGRMTARTSY